jgi:hypothetical protein
MEDTMDEEVGVGLGVRFAILILAVMTLAGTVMIGGFLGVERSYFLAEGRRTHQTHTDHLAQICAETLVNNDELGLMNVLKELKKSTDLEEAFCVDKNGKILAHSDVKMLGQKLDLKPPAWFSPLPPLRKRLGRGGIRVWPPEGGTLSFTRGPCINPLRSRKWFRTGYPAWFIGPWVWGGRFWVWL